MRLVFGRARRRRALAVSAAGLLWAAAAGAAPPASGEAPAIRIRATRLLDGRGGALDGPVVVTIRAGRIVSIEREKTRGPVDHDLAGLTV
ncbi:MAG TPA: hypothetical protein VIZ69_09525, partial [Thermoanaerobaculia bacterium]